MNPLFSVGKRSAVMVVVIGTAACFRLTAEAGQTGSVKAPPSSTPFLDEYDHRFLSVLKLKTLFSWLQTQPLELFQEMRTHRPIITARAVPTKFEPHFNSTVVVALKQDVLEVLDHPTIFSARLYGSKMNDTMGAYMLGRDNTPFNTVEKPYMRRIMKAEDFPLIQKQVAKLARTAIQEGTTVVEDPVTGKLRGRLEVVNSLARKVPIRLTGTYAGFPGPDEKAMYRWSRATQDDFFRNIKGDPQVHARAVQAGSEMREYIQKLIQEKRALLEKTPESEDTILARMLKEGTSRIDSLTDERLIILTAGMLIGAGETTQGAVVKSLAELLSRPAELQGAIRAARENKDDVVAQYVWEALRFQPVNLVLPRYAEQDYVLAKGTARETRIAKGALVLAATQSAMFDENSMMNPQQFRLDRSQDVYFHLGYGHHRCLGDYVSLIQVPQIVKSLLLKKNLRPAAGEDGKINYLGGGFPERFYVEFDFAETEGREAVGNVSPGDSRPLATSESLQSPKP